MDIFSEINEIKSNFSTPITVETYQDEATGETYSYDFDTKKEIAIATFMGASRYLGGNEDELGIKPYFNIINQMVDLEVRATDIDTANIVLRHTHPDYEIHAILVTKVLKQWFDSVGFAEVINDWNETGSRYGNSLLKASYDNGEVVASVPRWSSMTFDQYNIADGVKIETHIMTPLDLEKKRGVWDDEAIDEAIEYIEKKVREDEETERSIEVLEVEGEFMRKTFTEDDNTTGFSFQHYFIVDEEELGLIFFKEEIDSSNYAYYGRKKMDGRAWALGVSEQGKEAQGEINVFKTLERRAMAMSSKKLYITDDEEFQDSNVLTEKENGDVLLKKPNKTFAELSTSTNTLPMFENAISSWREQLKATLSAFDAVTGDSLPSGTTFRLGLLQAKQASSIFEYLRERRGQVLKKFIKDKILPALIKSKFKKDFVLSAFFTAKEIDLLNEKHAHLLAQRKLAEMFNNGKVDYVNYEEMVEEIKASLPKNEQMFITIEKGLMEGVLDNVEVVVTNESEDAEAKIATYSTFLQLAMQDVNNATFAPTAAQDLISEISRLSNTQVSGLLSKTKKDVMPQQAPQTPDTSAVANLTNQNATGIDSLLKG